VANFGRIKVWTEEEISPLDLNLELDNIINQVTNNGLDADNLDETDNYAWTGTHSFAGAVTFDLTTEDVVVVDAGSTSATEQDWIEVTVGGNTGYVRVYASK